MRQLPGAVGMAREYWNLYENGCYHFADCEQCKFADCILPSDEAVIGKMSESKRRYVDRNRDKLNAQNRERRRKKREKGGSA